VSVAGPVSSIPGNVEVALVSYGGEGTGGLVVQLAGEGGGKMLKGLTFGGEREFEGV
jgi:hypothetical protein